MGQFKQGIDVFTRKVENRTDSVVRKLVTAIARGVVTKTPVLTGRARGNWHLSLNAPTFASRNMYDKTGGRTIAEIRATIPKPAQGHNYFIQNHLTYIKLLEMGRSLQAPQGMVRLTLLEVDGMLREAVAEAQTEFA